MNTILSTSIRRVVEAGVKVRTVSVSVLYVRIRTEQSIRLFRH